MTPKQLIDEVVAVSGLALEEVAERLGLKLKTLQKIRWNDIPLTDSNREGLQKILEHYTNGQPHFDLESLHGAAALRLARVRAGHSVAQLAKLLGVSPDYLEKLETGTVRTSERLIEVICRVLPALSKEQLMDGSDDARVLGDLEATYGTLSKIKMPSGVKGRYVPVLSMAEAGPLNAGHSDAYYNYTAVFAPNVDDRRAFAIKVSGNSMEPDLREGDFVICAPESSVANGEAAVIRTRSEQVFIKFWRKVGDRAILESANADYKPIEFPLSEIAGVWPIVQHINSGRIKRSAS
jgi:phage repressor protein C with HTH and peptisase S24 domain